MFKNDLKSKDLDVNGYNLVAQKYIKYFDQHIGVGTIIVANTIFRPLRSTGDTLFNE